MNDLIILEQSPRLDLTSQETISMLNSAVANFANFVTSASELAKEVEKLRTEMDTLTLQCGDLALRLEQSDRAYRLVNDQRIAAEAEVMDLRADRDRLREANGNQYESLIDAKVKIADLEAEVLRLTADNEIAWEKAIRMEKQYHTITELKEGVEARAKDFEDLYALAQEDTKVLETSRDAAIKDRDYWYKVAQDAEVLLKEGGNKLASIRAIVG